MPKSPNLPRDTRGRKRSLPGLDHLSPAEYKRAYERHLYKLKQNERKLPK